MKKKMRLALRDPMCLLLLFALPLWCILVFGLVFGLFVSERFGRKPDRHLQIKQLDKRLRIIVLDLDRGSGLDPGEPWSRVVQRDLADNPGIPVEALSNREDAERLIREHKQAAILVFQPAFSDRINQCSFMGDGLNPFNRDGVWLHKVNAELWKDEYQPTTAAIIERAVQASMLRVILSWMIGRAFDQVRDPEFVQLLGDKVNLPVPKQFQFLLPEKKIQLTRMLKMASSGDKEAMELYKKRVGEDVQAALLEYSKKYNPHGKTWASLTKSVAEFRDEAKVHPYENHEDENKEGGGPLDKLGEHYKSLVLIVGVMGFMSASNLVWIAGWLLVAERRQGTLERWQTPGWLIAYILTAVLVATTYSAQVAILDSSLPPLLVYLPGPLVGLGCAIWAAMDSSNLELHKYKGGTSGPFVVFLAILILWPIVFPLYVVTRFRQVDGKLKLKKKYETVATSPGAQ